jgi:hypothetical protein
MNEIQLIKNIVDNIYNFELLKEIIPKEYALSHEIAISDMNGNTLLGFNEKYIDYQLLDEYISKKRKPSLELKSFSDYIISSSRRYNHICKKIPYKDPKYNFTMYIQNGNIYRFRELKKSEIITKVKSQLIVSIYFLTLYLWWCLFIIFLKKMNNKIFVYYIILLNLLMDHIASLAFQGDFGFLITFVLPIFIIEIIILTVRYFMNLNETITQMCDRIEKIEESTQQFDKDLNHICGRLGDLEETERDYRRKHAHDY